LAVSSWSSAIAQWEYWRRTQEEDLVFDAHRGIDLHLLDRCLEVGPPINGLVDQTKVVVKLDISLALVWIAMTHYLVKGKELGPRTILNKEALDWLYRQHNL
jgi:hypothetical protein